MVGVVITRNTLTDCKTKLWNIYHYHIHCISFFVITTCPENSVILFDGVCCLILQGMLITLPREIFELKVAEILNQNRLYYYWLCIPRNSVIVHCAILFNMPHCMYVDGNMLPPSVLGVVSLFTECQNILLTLLYIRRWKQSISVTNIMYVNRISTVKRFSKM